MISSKNTLSELIVYRVPSINREVQKRGNERKSDVLLARVERHCETHSCVTRVLRARQWPFLPTAVLMKFHFHISEADPIYSADFRAYACRSHRYGPASRR